VFFLLFSFKFAFFASEGRFSFFGIFPILTYNSSNLSFYLHLFIRNLTI
jgi:hypothetical protein